MRKRIFKTFFIIGLLLVVIQCIAFKGFESADIEGLILNLLTEVLGILLAFVFIDHYLAQLEDKRKKHFIKIVIYNEYKQLLNHLAQVYITFISKNSPQTKGDEDNIFNTLDEIMVNIDEYVHSNFIRFNIKTIRPKIDNVGNISVEEENYTYEQYCVLFKQFSANKIESFLLKYIMKLPDDAVKELSNMKNILLQPIFTTALENGIVIHGFENATFNPQDFKKPLLQYGKSLQALIGEVD